MFCQNCGTQNTDGAGSCSACGTALNSKLSETTVLKDNEIRLNQNQPEFQPNQLQAVQPQAQSFAPATVAVKLKNKKMLVGLIGGAVALLIVIISVIISISTSCDNTLKSFCKAYFNFDFAKAEKYCLLDQSDVFETYCKYSGRDIDELYEELNDEIYLEFDKEVKIKDVSDFYSLAGEYAQKLAKKSKIDMSSFKYEILSKEKVDLKDSEELERLTDEILIECDLIGVIDDDNLSDYIDVKDISKAYKVEIKITFDNLKGKEEEFDTTELYVAKYKGKWRVVAEPFGLM